MDNNFLIINKNEIKKYDIKTLLKKYDVIIVKKFLDKESILKNLYLIKKKNIFFLNQKYKPMIKNFTRLDRGKFYSKSNTGKIQKCSRYLISHFHFLWNKNSLFQEEFKKIQKLRNKIYDIKSKKPYEFYKNKKFINIPKILEYPKNGYLSWHTDYNNQNKINNFLGVLDNSKKNGSLIYKFGKKEISIEKYTNIGDIIIHSQNAKHKVSKIKYRKRFSLVLSLHNC